MKISNNTVDVLGNISFQLVDFGNVNQYIRVQNDIFPGEDATLHAFAACDASLFRDITGLYLPAGKTEYFLAYSGINIVGITGLYTYADTGKPNECWLAWYGVCNEFRGHGYGQSILKWTMQRAADEGYEVLRLHTSTSDLYQNAAYVYEKLGFTGEPYTLEEGGIVVYSISLTEKPLEMLGERFLNISSEVDLLALPDNKMEEIVNKYNEFIGVK